MSGIDPRHLRLIEAAVFAAAEPVSERSLQRLLPEDTDLAAILGELKETYAERGVNLVRAGQSWAFRTAPDVANALNKERTVARKLSRAAMETLAIVAYHQPVTRAEIEEIRGVSISKGTLDALFEEGWIKPRGRRKTPGRPMNWGTTDGFLDHFGFEDLRDLPGAAELKAAGLLDSRPAINAYRVRGDVAPANGDEDGDEGAETETLFDVIGDTPGETPEPLDPDDGEAGPGAVESKIGG